MHAYVLLSLRVNNARNVITSTRMRLISNLLKIDVPVNYFSSAFPIVLLTCVKTARLYTAPLKYCSKPVCFALSFIYRDIHEQLILVCLVLFCLFTWEAWCDSPQQLVTFVDICILGVRRFVNKSHQSVCVAG